jgi:hypothetical protein
MSILSKILKIFRGVRLPTKEEIEKLNKRLDPATFKVCRHKDSPTHIELIRYARECGKYPPNVHQCKECFEFFNEVMRGRVRTEKERAKWERTTASEFRKELKEKFGITLDENPFNLLVCNHADAPTLREIVEFVQNCDEYPPHKHQCKECLKYFNELKAAQKEDPSAAFEEVKKKLSQDKLERDKK